MLARSAGFEPTTPWFVARYSIQLSYERVNEAAHYSSPNFSVNTHAANRTAPLTCARRGRRMNAAVMRCSVKETRSPAAQSAAYLR